MEGWSDQKGVVVVEIGPDGRKDDPVVLPLPATPIYELTILNPAEDVPKLKVEYPDAKTDLVNLHIRYTAGVDNLEEVLRDLDRVFPRWYARDWQETGALGPTLAGAEAGGSKSFGETVRDYLGQELLLHDPAEKDAILNIADGLLKDME